jgi:hypothetical protein
MSFNSLPPLPEIEHHFFVIAGFFGGSEIVFIAVAALAILLFKLARWVIEEYYEFRIVAFQKRSAFLRERNRAPVS